MRSGEGVQDGFHGVSVPGPERKGVNLRTLGDESAAHRLPGAGHLRGDRPLRPRHLPGPGGPARVHTDDREAGRAAYASLAGGANLNEIIRTGPKLPEPVDPLTPKGAGR